MLNIICLKHGTKYGPEYVNNLYNMTQRHLTVPHNFVCFTENPKNIDTRIGIKPLPKDGLSGWWWKPYIFKQGHFQDGDVNLFFDLDMVIIGNIDKLVTYQSGEFLGLEDVGRVFKKIPQRLGSAVLRWPANSYTDIWDDLKTTLNLTKRFQGDQDYIWDKHKQSIKFYPEKWIMSYKWEVRSRAELVRINGRYNFNSIKSVEVDPETSVLAFHGTPDPHEVKDPIIVDNWR